MIDLNFFPFPNTPEWSKAVRLLSAEIKDGSSYAMVVHPHDANLAKQLAKDAMKTAKVRGNIETNVWSTEPSRWSVEIEPYV